MAGRLKPFRTNLTRVFTHAVVLNIMKKEARKHADSRPLPADNLKVKNLFLMAIMCKW
jgi:hypothetical protein